MYNDDLAYEAPVISVIGTLAEVTQGNAAGSHLDKAFPANTPSSELTFS